MASSWTRGADFPGTAGDTYGASAAAVGNQVAVFGSTNNAYVYDVAADDWTTMPVSGDAPSQRHSASSAQSRAPGLRAASSPGGGERVWLFGGAGFSWPEQFFAETWELDPATFTWVRRADMPLALQESATAAFQVDGRTGVLLFGGLQSDYTASGRAFIYWPDGPPPTATPTPAVTDTPTAAGTITNTVNVAGNELDPYPNNSAWTITTATICYDFNGNGLVDIGDIQAIAARWGLTEGNPDPDNDPNTPNYEIQFDVAYDGTITIQDIMAVVSHWRETCP